jgi:outer membrane protein assembly factor BamB
VKHPRALLAGPLLLLLALTLSACGGVKNPEGWASPVSSGSTVYYFPKKDHLAAITLAADGSAKTQWQFPNQLPDQKDLNFKYSYGITLADGVLYLGSWNDHFYAINASDGSLKWSFKNVSGGLVAAPTVANGLVFFGTNDGHLYALNASDGSPAAGWPAGGRDIGRGIWAPVLVKDQVAYVATLEGKVYAFNIADGSDRWAKPFESSGAVANLGFLDDTHLFVPTLDKKVYRLDIDSGTADGPPYATHDWVWTTATVVDNVAYFGDHSDRVYALDITKWQEKFPPVDVGAPVKSTPVVIGDVLVVASRDPEVLFLDRNSGEILNRVPIQGGTVRADLTVMDGKALIATTNGQLYVADPSARRVVQVTVGVTP